MLGDNTFFKDDANTTVLRKKSDRMKNKYRINKVMGEEAGLKQVTVISQYIFATPKEESG